jgi:hypothetical protein
MIQTRSLFVVFLAASSFVVAGCEQKSSPPPTSSAGQGLNNLASNPTSIPGKSAAMGKNAVAGIEARQDEAANAANQITGQGGAEFVIGGIKFAVPKEWKSVAPSSGMVKATYMIADAGNAQCNFSTAGGDVQSNIDRWRKQMTDAAGAPITGDVTEHSAGGFRVYLFKATGNYSSMSAGKQANTAFRGAIIQMPSESVFVRLTGPADKIGPAETAWEQMVLGLSR